jgi:hypothetical protein
MPSEGDVTAMLVNPFYTISVDPDRGLARGDRPARTVGRGHKHLIDELGVELWLRRLLAVLEGSYPTNPDDPTIADGYRVVDH